MMIEKRIELGRIACPTCGMADGMRITQDKNGEPFGYCDAGCNQQMRIGGSSYRVGKFVARYPWAVPKPVTVPDTKPEPIKPEPVPEKPARQVQAKPLPPKPKGTGNAFLDLIQGVN